MSKLAGLLLVFPFCSVIKVSTGLVCRVRMLDWCNVAVNRFTCRKSTGVNNIVNDG